MASATLLNRFFVTLTIVMLGLQTISRAEEQPVRIGAILSITGSSAAWGKNIMQGIELARTEINAQGGIGGRPITLFYEDFGEFGDGNLQRAAVAAQKLIAIHKVDAIITQWSEDTEAILPITTEHGVPIVSVGAGADRITKGRPLLARLWPSDRGFIEQTVAHAVALGKRRAAVIAAQTSYFNSLGAMTRELWLKNTGTAVVYAEVKPNETDFRSLLLKIKQGGCDVIFLHIPVERIGIAFRQLRALRMDLLKIVTQGSDQPSVIAAAGTSAEGAIVPGYEPATLQFVEKYRKVYSEPPGIAADFAYDTLSLMAHAMRRHGVSGLQLMRGLREVKDYPGASGVVTITADGDREGKTVVLKEIRDGKSRPLAPDVGDFRIRHKFCSTCSAGVEIPGKVF